MNRSIFIALGIIACISCYITQGVEVSANDQLEARPSWVLSGLDSPESVIPDASGTFFYVSNVNGEAAEKNGAGYISRISFDGQLLEKKWVTGLNAPKGMAVKGSTLFVSDIDQLVLIDTSSGAIEARIDMPGAVFLNDVTVTPVGTLVSDSANARIYRYADGDTSVWLEDERLGGVNGLLLLPDRLLITTMSAGELLSFDWESKALSVVAGGMKNADGVSILADGSYLVSSWPGKLYHVQGNGEHRVLLDTEAKSVNINDIFLMGTLLVTPNWSPGSVRAFIIE